MKYIIFYSWQSDLPNNTNRSFIETVIEKAIKNTNGSDLYDLEPSIDRDTKGVPGAPNITQAIIDKIKASDAFVADISIVTGISDENERPSPNPNVLLELGYAIALLGWDKIILFCNNVYGTDEDLPFDIRQHRRIGYTLRQDDPKSLIRNNLAKHFKSRMIELLKEGKTRSYAKLPMLDISWNYIDIDSDGGLESGADSTVIQLRRPTDISEIAYRIEQEIDIVKETDGSVDPQWNEKKKSYIKRANDFIEQISDKEKRNNYLIDNNADKFCPITLTVNNEGNASASDIRVEIPLPEWLLAFEKFPSKEDIPTKPNMPIPSPPKAGGALNVSSVFGSIANMNLGIDHALLGGGLNRTSACYLKEGGNIYFWADRLLHKHTITNRKDWLYLLALPNAVPGEHSIKGNVFCSEYDDWKEIELIINVV